MAISANSRIIVTGGAGFIGSALIWELNQRGCRNIIVVDRLHDGEKWRNLTPLQFADFVHADDFIEQLEEKRHLLGPVGAVFHLGACSATTERDADYLIRNNYQYTKRLAEWSMEVKARFLYASSAATYGDGSEGMDDRERNLSRFRPLNMYGYSKHLFDCYAARNRILGGMIGLKYFNVFGPNENHKGDMRSVVNKAYAQVVETGKIQLFKSHHPDYADGEQKRDFLYVKDAVRMTLALADHPLAGGLFNIGSGIAHTWVDLANAIFAAMGRKPKIDFIEMPEAIRSKYQYFTEANIGKLRDNGYTAGITPLEDAVGDYVQNYLDHDRRLGDGDESDQPVTADPEEGTR